LDIFIKKRREQVAKEKKKYPNLVSMTHKNSDYREAVKEIKILLNNRQTRKRVGLV